MTHIIDDIELILAVARNAPNATNNGPHAKEILEACDRLEDFSVNHLSYEDDD